MSDAKRLAEIRNHSVYHADWWAEKVGPTIEMPLENRSIQFLLSYTEKLEARIAELEKMLEVAEMAFKEHRDNWTYPGEEHECASECGTICRAFASIAKLKESAVSESE